MGNSFLNLALVSLSKRSKEHLLPKRRFRLKSYYIKGNSHELPQVIPRKWNHLNRRGAPVAVLLLGPWFVGMVEFQGPKAMSADPEHRVFDRRYLTWDAKFADGFPPSPEVTAWHEIRRSSGSVLHAARWSWGFNPQLWLQPTPPVNRGVALGFDFAYCCRAPASRERPWVGERPTKSRRKGPANCHW